MYRINILCVGTLKEKPIAELFRTYQTRLGSDVNFSISELKDSGKEKENEKILEHLEKMNDKCVICLSEEGKQYSSIEFSQRLKSLSIENRQPVFVIGGPDGLDDKVKKKADILLSISKMTFTHEMARLLLMEQIYRAFTIMQGKSYHR